jgi:hypothetical protein
LFWVFFTLGLLSELHYYHYVVGFVHSNRVHVHLRASKAQLAQDRQVKVEVEAAQSTTMHATLLVRARVLDRYKLIKVGL